ncbi:hypothetical protein B4U80_14857 [Leptotrombidium deliense]|uniref:Uncharacterized protein n=1 Tax=Leptotrombidium deliense TaxID=299467 RepID=A0A443SLR4_9ACAR|nr:hypothetical protein B4U80_14857 [Leptotrombidium deliense]
MAKFGVRVINVEPNFYATNIVKGGTEALRKLWDETDVSVRRDYGERYVNRIAKNFEESVCLIIRDKPEEVAEAVLESLIFSVTETKYCSFTECSNPKIDAIIWSYKTEPLSVYLFNENKFWKFNLKNRTLGEMQSISDVWPEVDTPLSSASAVKNRNASVSMDEDIIFIQDQQFWMYSNKNGFKKRNKLISKGTLKNKNFKEIVGFSGFSSNKSLSIKNAILCMNNSLSECQTKSKHSKGEFSMTIVEKSCKKLPITLKMKHCEAMAARPIQGKADDYYIVISFRDILYLYKKSDNLIEIDEMTVGTDVFKCDLGFLTIIIVALSLGAIIVLLVFVTIIFFKNDFLKKDNNTEQEINNNNNALSNN